MDFNMFFDNDDDSTFLIERPSSQKSSQSYPTSTRGRKRRLDHLTWEEKMQRKKMKNRVAAQVSRDRKKAKFETMEQSLHTLLSTNKKLIEDNSVLKEQNEKLQTEVSELRKKLNDLPVFDKSANCLNENAAVLGSYIGSAVSKVWSPLPKGQVRSRTQPWIPQTNAEIRSQTQAIQIFLRILMIMYLFRSCSTKSTLKLRLISTLKTLKALLTIYINRSPNQTKFLKLLILLKRKIGPEHLKKVLKVHYLNKQ